LKNPIIKKLLVEWFKVKALNSNPSTAKKKKKKKKKISVPMSQTVEVGFID
jgi:hypothetical protein